MNTQTLVGLAGLGVSFAIVYPLLLSKLSLRLASPYAKAESWRRLYAAAIDGMVVASIFALAWPSVSITYLAMAATYILLRDAISGRSVGKFLFGLRVVTLETGRPGSARDSVSRNVIFMLPGANVAAVLLEARTLTLDQQGMRLGDRLALTQVVDGYGAKDLALDLKALLDHSIAHLDHEPTGRRRRRAPARIDRAA